MIVPPAFTETLCSIHHRFLIVHIDFENPGRNRFNLDLLLGYGQIGCVLEAKPLSFGVSLV